MASRVELSALGVTVGVTLEGLSDEQFVEFARSWSRCIPAAPSDFTTELRGELVGERAPGASHIQATQFTELADRLTSAVTISAIEIRKNDLLLLHAGGVADHDTGTVVAYIGPSGRGKTTASISLSHSFDYVTDETMAIGDDLTVVPYPKPLSVKLAPPALWKVQASPDDLGLGQVREGPLRLVALILLDRDPEYPETQPPLVSPVSLAEAMSELVPQISYLPDREAPLHRLRDIIAACGGLRRVTYRESGSLLPVVAELLNSTVVEGFAFEAPLSRVTPGLATTAGRDEFVRAAVTDSIADGSAEIVLNQGTVRVLDGIAPTIWRYLAMPHTLSDIVREVVATHGEPPDRNAEGLVLAALEELVRVGIVVVGQ